jgi:hypothetical protein
LPVAVRDGRRRRARAASALISRVKSS